MVCLPAYLMVKNFWQYDYSFRQNSRMQQTHRQTDTYDG